MTAHVTVLGSINMDLVVYTDRLPSSGETVLGTSFQTFPGGKGANQAVAAARMGARVAMLARVGDDAFGGQLMTNLRANWVDADWVKRTDTASGTALITVDREGRNTIVVVPGANGEVLPADLDSWQDALTAADVLMMQLEIPLETVLEAARRAMAAGAVVVLNPSPARPLPEELLSLVDVLVMNEPETALISGMGAATQDQIEQAASALLERGVGWVVVTLGEEGALAVSRAGTILSPGFKVKVVDTVAAGDAFTGALAAALAEGVSKVKPAGRAALQEALEGRRDILRIANAAGALAVTVRGAQPSLPTRAQVDDFLRSR